MLTQMRNYISRQLRKFLKMILRVATKFRIPATGTLRDWPGTIKKKTESCGEIPFVNSNLEGLQ